MNAGDDAALEAPEELQRGRLAGILPRAASTASTVSLRASRERLDRLDAADVRAGQDPLEVAAGQLLDQPLRLPPTTIVQWSQMSSSPSHVGSVAGPGVAER